MQTAYYDLPKSQRQVSDEEAMFDRLLDIDSAAAGWFADAAKHFPYRERVQMAKSSRAYRSQLKGAR